MTAPLIETARLQLRELEAGDFDAVHAYASDPEVVEYMSWGPNTEQQTRDFLDRAMVAADCDPRTQFVFAVALKEGGPLFGTVGLYLSAPEAHSAMLGYAYARPAWGTGYATETVEAVLSLAFDVLGLRRVWAGCDPDNVASARVLQKCGMTLEGHLRDEVEIRGRLRDSLVWGILLDDWRTLQDSEERE